MDGQHKSDRPVYPAGSGALGAAGLAVIASLGLAPVAGPTVAGLGLSTAVCVALAGSRTVIPQASPPPVRTGHANLADVNASGVGLRILLSSVVSARRLEALSCTRIGGLHGP